MINWIVALIIMISPAYAMDKGQWPDNETTHWYRTLMQPDHPTVSCCGEGDAYWCDVIVVREGKTYCKITDDREDAPLGRNHIDMGTEIPIPDYKLKWDKGNPTGHAIIFTRMGYDGTYNVFCFVQGAGI